MFVGCLSLIIVFIWKRSGQFMLLQLLVLFFYCYYWWMYFVRQLLRMTMLHINRLKKCINCDAEFASKRAADCHRRHPAYNGTAWAYPSNIQSLSLPERPDISVGILRQHSAAPLGAWMYILHQPLTSYISHFNWNPNH